MTLARTLAELGIPETEARFYLAALELGEMPIRDIAEKAGISRTNAYDVLARLLDEGLVTTHEGPGKVLRVAAVGPERLIALFDDRRRRLAGILPELQSLHVGSSAKPRVRFYEGTDGIETVLEETLACRSKQLVGILSMRDLYEAPGRDWMDGLVRRRIAAGVSLRVVRARSADIHANWMDSAEELRELRFAPESFVSTMTTYVYDEKVAIISSRRENFGMTIESPEFAALQRQLFDALWAASTPAPQTPRPPKSTRSRRPEIAR
ncbi:helix-turn-helix domain-containing protein [Rhodoplanes sp. TEM]|uniref:Helix-turn-helix domain-containing protein n=1 Tax=Rhodoplanes tepidamans TaxID=200616 RepID=A0ABT5JD62_RHOTP|nr:MULTISPECIES: helix-turn-helix domain-containing protein [Rhodoplanes]MDC7787556.1 helix-turn-helix domain-containing protein [Rhodoplanes tepidamans]MDC7984951.1 helix-turn-helix domain-containing protein [Rhodoplanes sp. TEM]MDQ0357985.1 sugar-specific transcriptional regulator TrmB [Rhodoplanes tepidamans]